MAKIKTIIAREILDSRGSPTVETKIILDSGATATASVPSGVSVGKYEAVELRDQDPHRFHGRGVLRAIASVNQTIAEQIVGREFASQLQLDETLIKLDGTKEKAKLGANAILSVSEAFCKAMAMQANIPCFAYVAHLYGLGPNDFKMPTPMSVQLEGGKHGAGNLDFQEFLVIPSSGQTFAEALRMLAEIYWETEKVLIQYQAVHSVGDEGGYAPNLFTNLDALEVLAEAIQALKYNLGRQVFLGLDVAPAYFYHQNKYRIKDRTTPMTTEELVEFYRDLLRQYPLASIEDPFHEDDWGGWTKLAQFTGNTIIVGDDLLTTNKQRVQQALRKGACSAILIKPNQVGTVAETIEVIKLARQAGWKVIVSHRGGETNEDFIADFAVGVGADYVKFGAPARGERVAKYNRLLAIEKMIDQNAHE